MKSRVYVLDVRGNYHVDDSLVGRFESLQGLRGDARIVRTAKCALDVLQACQDSLNLCDQQLKIVPFISAFGLSKVLERLGQGVEGDALSSSRCLDRVIRASSSGRHDSNSSSNSGSGGAACVTCMAHAT